VTYPVVISKRASSLRQSFGWPDLVVLLALVGLLATLAWLGHGMWVPLGPGALPALDLAPRNLPYYAGRSLLRMFIALGASLLFTFLVASWAAKSGRAARVIPPALDILQSVPVLGFLSATVTFSTTSQVTPGTTRPQRRTPAPVKCGNVNRITFGSGVSGDYLCPGRPNRGRQSFLERSLFWKDEDERMISEISIGTHLATSVCPTPLGLAPPGPLAPLFLPPVQEDLDLFVPHEFLQ
jgi:hypothetical protein